MKTWIEAKEAVLRAKAEDLLTKEARLRAWEDQLRAKAVILGVAEVVMTRDERNCATRVTFVLEDKDRSWSGDVNAFIAEAAQSVEITPLLPRGEVSG